VARWRAFLATATRGTYAACYCGETLGLEPADEAAYAALAAWWRTALEAIMADRLRLGPLS
jgi:hypothetical protein